MLCGECPHEPRQSLNRSLTTAGTARPARCAMNSTFGARLRQQREERQVALTTISTKTKIKASLLEALESDDVSTWPKGLYGRAYLRDYATAIGIDPETLVSDFLALHPEFAY